MTDRMAFDCALCGHPDLAHHVEDDSEGEFEWCGGTNGRNCGCTSFVKEVKGGT